MLERLQFHTNLYGAGGASYYLTVQGKEFVAATAPAIARHAATASAQLARFANYIGVGTAYAKYSPIVAEKIVKFTPNFKALTTLSPLHGVVAGASLSLAAIQVEDGLSNLGMRGNKWAVIRVPASHAIAGAAVLGLSALALKVGLAATALTVSGAVTLAVTSLAVDVAVRTVFKLFRCCRCEGAPNEPEQKPNVSNQSPAPAQQPAQPKMPKVVELKN